MSEIDELTREKLVEELKELRKPWWKKALGMFAAAAIAALATSTVGLAFSNQSLSADNTAQAEEIRIQKAIIDDLVEYSAGYAVGVLNSPSGNAALDAALASKDKERIYELVGNVTRQTVIASVEKHSAK